MADNRKQTGGGGFGRKGSGKPKKGSGRKPVGKGALDHLDRIRNTGRRFWLVLASLFFTGAIILLGVLAYLAKDLPDISKLKSFEKSPGIRVYSTDGRMLASYGQVVGESLKYDQIPKELIAAVIATEDRRFFDHSGIDPIGVLRASVRNALAGGIVQGGSTITQQLAKNVFLTADRTLSRKFQEVLLAIWLENHFSKKEIMELYLNRVYLGAGNYGVDAAAYHYFNKSARKVNLQEAALLAGLLKAPSRYAPTSDPEAARNRTKQVILNMQDADLISEKEAQLAISHIKQDMQLRKSDGGSYRYFTDWVVDLIPNFVGRVDGDLEILTTFDPTMQAKAQAALDKVMSAESEKMKASQAALVSMQPDGAVRALIGGVNYGKSQFNRVTQAKRQPGSAFKLLVYLAALEQGYTPDTIVSDRPVTIGKWSPRNYTGEYLGEIPLREAFYKSINTVAAIITHKIGPQRVVQMSRRLGITSKLLATPSISLGTNEVTILEMTKAYAHVASGGRKVVPYAIREIRKKDGKLLYRHGSGGRPQVLPSYVVAQMNNLLTSVVQQGTARRAQIGRPTAGKTGTTQDYRDAWFLGFTPQMVTGVWVGNDNFSPTKKVTGGSLPAQIWADYMKAALADLPPLPILQQVVYDEAPVEEGYDAYSADAMQIQNAAPQPAATDSFSETAPPLVQPQPSDEMQMQPVTPPALDAPQVLIPPSPSAAPAPKQDGVFDWYEQELNQQRPQEQPVKDDTLIDKLFTKIKDSEVEYDYPNERKRR